MRKKFKLGKDVLVLTIITLITVLTWVSVEVWAAFSKITITQVTQEQMAPLNPDIKMETIQSLKTNFSPSEEELNIAVSPEVEIESEELPAATESGQPATESAQEE